MRYYFLLNGNVPISESHCKNKSRWKIEEAWRLSVVSSSMEDCRWSYCLFSGHLDVLIIYWVPSILEIKNVNIFLHHENKKKSGTMSTCTISINVVKCCINVVYIVISVSALVDRTLESDDTNKDGYISYAEYRSARARNSSEIVLNVI